MLGSYRGVFKSNRKLFRTVPRASASAIMGSHIDWSGISPWVYFGATAATLSTASLVRDIKARSPPKPKKIPHDVHFGHVEGEDRGENPMNPPIVHNDDLFWLRDDDRKDPNIIRHLEKENTYADYMTRHLADSTDTLYREMLSRLKQTDSQVPYKHGPYQYYVSTVEGLSYPLYCRQALKNGKPGEEELYLDVNTLGEGKSHCDVTAVSPSPSHQLIAYGVDYEGNEDYDIHCRRASGHSANPDFILEKTSGNLEWGADDKVLFYTTKDETMRPDKLWMHIIGTRQSEDVLLLEEEDDRFVLGIGKARSERFLVAEASSKTTAECHLLDLRKVQDWLNKTTQNEKPPAVSLVKPREDDVLYEVDHWIYTDDQRAERDLLLILTNAGVAKNFKVCVTPVAEERQEDTKWIDLIPHRYDVVIEDVDCFRDFVVLEGRQNSHPHVWIVHAASLKMAVGNLDNLSHSVEHIPTVSRVPTIDEIYDIGTSPANEEWDAAKLRYIYSSPTCPQTTYEFDVEADARSGDSGLTREATIPFREPSLKNCHVLKTKEVPNFDPKKYSTARIFVEVRDGTLVPISLVWCPGRHSKPNFSSDQTFIGKPAPMLLDGYGSYGASIDMDFDYKLLSLCDRGVVYAFAHVRGGGEMGRKWYEDEGKFLQKKNTFNDFVDCADKLIELGWAEKSRIATVGRSAGGLLMGNSLNLRPELWKCVVASVPFVDLMTTMCDPSIPLTVEEWEEWGNPNEAKYYDYMLSYSPMNNIGRKPYPITLLQAGLNDHRVAYWEPAKFAARLRENTTSKNPILLKTDLSSGHFSASDRYKWIRERAFEYAFLLDNLEVFVK